MTRRWILVVPPKAPPQSSGAGVASHPVQSRSTKGGQPWAPTGRLSGRAAEGKAADPAKTRGHRRRGLLAATVACQIDAVALDIGIRTTNDSRGGLVR